MLSARGMHCADQLRAMMDDGVLPACGPVELTYATIPKLDLATRVTLAEVDHLRTHGVDVPNAHERWLVAEADIEMLWRLATTAPERR